MFLRIQASTLKTASKLDDDHVKHVDYDYDDDDGPSDDEFKDELDSNHDSFCGSETEVQKQDTVFKKIKIAIKEFKKNIVH